MNTRAISTSVAISSCDVCGRTLLRGEKAETYVNGVTRHSVCELCTSRALHGGWVREGELPDYGDAGARPDRRRSLFGRRRSRRDPTPARAEDQYTPDFESYDEPVAPPPPRGDLTAPPTEPAPAPVRAEISRASARAGGRPVPREPRPAQRESRGAQRESRGGQREPRHVRAVPTSNEHKVSSSVAVFNDSEHPRTVAGISRSLGLPDVSVLPSSAQSSVVHIVISWELCWYRYELDLSDEAPTVRVATQGYELDELAPEERHPNAVADERGTLALGT